MEKKGLYNITTDNEAVVNLKGFIVGMILFPFYLYGIPRLLSMAINLFSEKTGYVVSQVLYNLYFYLIMMAIILLLFGRFLVDSFKRIKTSAPIYWWIAAPILGLLGVYAGNSVAMIITNLLTDRQESVNNETVFSFFNEMPPVIILMTVVFAPIVEEIMFRAIVFRPIARLKYGRFFAYLIACLGFASIHVVSNAIELGDPTELIFIVSYLPAAIALAAVYQTVKNIWGSIFVHSMINAIGMFAYAVSERLG